MLEAWLLADPIALEKVLSISVQEIHNSEKHLNPKEKLKRLFSKAKRSYTEAVAGTIAKELDMARLIKNVQVSLSLWALCQG